MSDFLKPRTADELLDAFNQGLAVRVVLQPQHEAQLDQVDRHGFTVREKIVSDDKGPVFLHLPRETKYAWIVRCQLEGCSDIRVVRTSDIAGRGPGIAFCVAHSKGGGGSTRGGPTPLDGGDFDVGSLTSED